MAKYSDIKGFTVQTLSTDTVASQFAGGSWASGGSLNAARNQMAGVGSQTAALGFGGNTSGSPKSAANEQYNGSSWTEVGDLNSGRGGMYGFGTTTAAIGSGGLVYPFNPSNFATNLTESWNGSAWTETSDMTYGRAAGGSATSGTSTAGLIFGGGYLSPSPNYALVAYTESWNGSGWTETADLNSARGYGMGGSGTQTSALAYAGNIPPSPSTNLIATESWDGSSWTEVADMNTKREGVAGSGADNTSAIAVGGNVPPVTGITEIWDGTSWTEVADLSTARSSVGSAGTTVASLAFGGSAPSLTTAAEEFTAPSTFTKQVEGQLFFNSTANAFKETITDIPGGTWSSGGTMNNDERYFSGGAGIKTAAIAFGGDSPQINKTESYNGTSWTEVNNLNTTKNYVSGAGTYTAALCINGYQNPPNVDLNQVESWDGTNWTEITETNETANAGNVSCGTQTAALITMRSPTPIAGRTELWNGSAWTETTDLNTARPNGAVFGISTSSLASGGSPGATYTQAESWDGSAWTEVGDLNLGRQSLGSAGANNLSGIIFAGNRPGASSPAPGYTEAQRTEFWNGTSWTEINDMSTDRAGGSSSKSGGSATSAHAAGGNAPPYTGVTEEWTADLANKTITAS
jgi:hypothetical protein